MQDETPLENALICLEKIKRILVTTDRELFATAEMEMKKQVSRTIDTDAVLLSRHFVFDADTILLSRHTVFDAGAILLSRHTVICNDNDNYEIDLFRYK